MKRRLKILTAHIFSNHIKQTTKSNENEIPKKEPETLIKFSNEVKEAIKSNKPIVALESTIISHGMPYPQNVHTAQLVEQQIKKYGSVPATIAILDGALHIGLNFQELKRLGQLGKKVRKCSRRDIALCMAKKLNGATTVSATMLIAHLVGIKVFVTGGIGGVHRDFQETMDISADLRELGKTPVAVVCAGVKSILDIPRTLEYLETEGVNVVSYQTEEFPAFFTRNSGSKGTCRLDTPQEVASLIHYQMDVLNLQTGILIGVPVPLDQEASAKKINKATKLALQEMKENKIKGKNITPFLLKRINELTNGESLKSNIALVLNNAKVGSQIAAKLYKQKNIPVLIGGVAIDVTGTPKKGKKLILETSNPGKVNITFGGVSRNVAQVLLKLGKNPLIISCYAGDKWGALIENHFSELGLDMKGMKKVESTEDGRRTALFNCLIDEGGNLMSAVADMDIFEKEISPDYIKKYTDEIKDAPFVFMDTNLSVMAINEISTICKTHGVPLFLDPVSVEKSLKIIKCQQLNGLAFIKPNEDEIRHMVKSITSKKSASVSLRDCIYCLLKNGVENVLLTCGKQGVYHGYKNSSKRGKNSFQIDKYKALKIPSGDIKNTTGCGDSFVGGFLFGLLEKKSIRDCIQLGIKTATLTLKTNYSVHPNLSSDYLNATN